MFHELQQELNTLLYIYFTSKGLLHLNHECSDLIPELENCVSRIKEIFKEMENDIIEYPDIPMQDLEDAEAFLDWFTLL